MLISERAVENACSAVGDDDVVVGDVCEPRCELCWLDTILFDKD